MLHVTPPLMAIVLAATVTGADQPRPQAWLAVGTSLFRVHESIDGTCREGGHCSYQIRRRFDTSPLMALTVAYPVGARTHLEASVAAAPFHQLHTRATSEIFLVPIELRRDIVSLHFGVGGRYDLRAGATRPFLAAGIERILHVIVDDLPFRDSAWDTALVVGGGLDLPLGSKLRARIDLSDHIVPDYLGSDEVGHDVHFRAGLRLRF
jgi:hypothetical protein